VHVELAPLDNESTRLVANDASPDDQASHSEALRRVRDALATLPARDVTILGLHYLEDMTFQEIAAELHVTPSRVCQLLWRAVDRVRTQLGATVAKEAA
jgi:RNA polymerase sigma factor (sigma-70 family)